MAQSLETWPIFSTGYLRHLLSRMNDVNYVNNSFTFFHISIRQWIHLNFILQCYLNHSFNSLGVHSEVTNVKSLFRSWALYSVIYTFRTQIPNGLVAGMLFSISTNITEKYRTGCSENKSTIHWKSSHLSILDNKIMIISKQA